MKSYCKDKVPEVLQALFHACVQDHNVTAIKLWLESYAPDFLPKENQGETIEVHFWFWPSQFVNEEATKKYIKDPSKPHIRTYDI